MGYSLNGPVESGQAVYQWNEKGPVYGPNGLLELDPYNQQCGNARRPVFAICNNNCPGGEYSFVTNIIFFR